MKRKVRMDIVGTITCLTLPEPFHIYLRDRERDEREVFLVLCNTEKINQFLSGKVLSWFKDKYLPS